MDVSADDFVFVVCANGNLFNRRKRSKAKKCQKKSPNKQKGNEMKPLNKKRLTRILADNPSADWFEVKEIRLTEKKNPKLQNRFKALYVCARYWAQALECEARAIIVEPSNGEMFPKAVLQLRPRRAEKQLDAMSDLLIALEDLVAEVDKLAELAQQMSDVSKQMARRTETKQTNGLEELLEVIEADIRNRRLSSEMRQAWKERPVKVNPVRRDFE